MTLLETRLGQTERRIEREMTQIHSKMDDVFRSIPDKSYVFILFFFIAPFNRPPPFKRSISFPI